MFELIIETKTFIDEYAELELKEILKTNPIKITSGIYSIKIKDENNLIKTTLDIIYFSRTFTNIYLKINNLDLDFIKSEFTFEVDAQTKNKKQLEKEFGQKILESNNKLKVNLDKPQLSFILKTFNNENYLLLDLAGFDLHKREYKINSNSNSLNSLIPNFCFYLLNLHKQKQFSIIDPLANLGDIIIEASLFNPRKPLNLKNRYQLPLIKIFSNPTTLPKVSKDTNKYIGIVQNNKIFKQIKENIDYLNSKIKISQYDLDWLDVKFKAQEIDYVISNLPIIKDEEEFDLFQKEFFYMTEFIVKKKICLISKKPINKKYLKKFKLNLEKEIIINISEQKYIIYLIS